MFETSGYYEKILFLSLGQNPEIKQVRLIAAGNINQGIYLKTSSGSFFLKSNFESNPEIFEKEADGLQILRENCPLQVPEVIHLGKEEERNYLLMEWIYAERTNPVYWQELGVGLAQLHMATQKKFGYSQDNFISSLVQTNSPRNTWHEFFIENRLEPLAGKAYYEGLMSLESLKRLQKTYSKLENIFPKEKPSLLHGDLWSGNILRGKKGSPSLIDPAVYYGHREMDLAFSRMFGGFEEEFYQCYETVFPLEPGFEERIPVYNLYPLLVHLLLFGKSYLSGIERTVNKLVQ